MPKWTGEKEINTRLRDLTKEVQAVREELRASLRKQPRRSAEDKGIKPRPTDEPPQRSS